MGNAIINRSFNDYQLVSLGIELVHRIMDLKECNPSVLKLAKQWNERFIDIVSKEGA
jgi:hypothetical protein